ncbi:hypothetical protein Tsubulata_018853 [Turnera subulata]|uniref:Jasmonate O-methyltransferase n=1 Tax=Turnera subulata TaxID=218843 RepID=A0A9Q0FLJ6_9ROSI|nr:hypothetical protein Tsubulata_018853 [Turnera subulata]
MEVMQVLHMNKGDGEASYAKNSTIQNKILRLGKPRMEDALEKLLWRRIPESMGIAELGCSSGPNALVAVSEIIEMVYKKCLETGHPIPELRVFLNDLPCNDFNCVFGYLPAFYNKLNNLHKGPRLGPCFVSAMPGSFYGRLFPSRSLNCVHSSSSLHWLSQVPPGLESNASKVRRNKGKIYISESSPKWVVEAYYMQFQRDFSEFLRSRAEEIVGGGCMILSFMGRRSLDPTTPHSCYQWELLAQALMSMVSQGLVEEEKVDSFNAPYYAPSVEEVKLEIDKEGSFEISGLEDIEINWDGSMEDEDEGQAICAAESCGKRVAKLIRAVVEPMLASHFGGELMMDDLFTRYGDLVDGYLSKSRTKYINLVISMVRRHNN